MKTKAADLEVYVERLVSEKGMEGLDPEILKEVKADLMDRLENRLNATIIANMPAEKLGEFEKILDTDDAKKMQEFTAAQIPDLEQVLALEMLNFRESYLNP